MDGFGVAAFSLEPGGGGLAGFLSMPWASPPLPPAGEDGLTPGGSADPATSAAAATGEKSNGLRLRAPANIMPAIIRLLMMDLPLDRVFT